MAQVVLVEFNSYIEKDLTQISNLTIRLLIHSLAIQTDEL